PSTSFAPGGPSDTGPGGLVSGTPILNPTQPRSGLIPKDRGPGSTDSTGWIPQQGQGQTLNPNLPAMPGSTPAGGGLGGGMYTYQPSGAFTYSPTTLGQAPLVGQAPQVAATGTQALNAGQDALMQMIRRNQQPATDPSLQVGLGTQTQY